MSLYIKPQTELVTKLTEHFEALDDGTDDTDDTAVMSEIDKLLDQAEYIDYDNIFNDLPYGDVAGRRKGDDLGTFSAKNDGGTFERGD